MSKLQDILSTINPFKKQEFVSPLPDNETIQNSIAMGKLVSPLATNQENNIPSPMPTPLQFSARNPDVKKDFGDKESKFQEILKALDEASKKTSIPRELFEDIAYQESKFDPSARNEEGTATGLMQFTEPTWTDMMRYYPDVAAKMDDRLDPLISAIVAGNEIKKGRIDRWDASKPVWGEYYNEDELNF